MLSALNYVCVCVLNLQKQWAKICKFVNQQQQQMTFFSYFFFHKSQRNIFECQQARKKTYILEIILKNKNNSQEHM